MKVSHVFLYFCTMHSVAYVPVVLHFVCLPVPAEISACVNELSALIRYSKHPSEGHERESEILTQKKKIKISGRIRKWDSAEFRCLSPLRVSAQARAAQHSSVAHIDRHMHITDSQRTAEVKPSLPSCVCLGVEVSGDEQKTKLPVPRIYS